MSKDLILVIIIFGILVAIIGIFIFLKYSKDQKIDQIKEEISFDELLKRLKNQSTTNNELKELCEIALKRFEINEKTKDDFLMFLFLLIKHKNIDSKTILNFQKDLKTKAPQYSKEIELYTKAGLDER